MANVTQKVPNLLGGVSTLPDVQKRPGELREAENVYIDPTRGLSKRNGMRWLTRLGDDTRFSTGHWFDWKRSETEIYIGCFVSDGSSNHDLFLWDKTGAAVTVSYQSYGATADQYINTGSSDLRGKFKVLARENYLIIVNTTRDVTADTVLGGSDGKTAGVGSYSETSRVLTQSTPSATKFDTIELSTGGAGFLEYNSSIDAFSETARDSTEHFDEEDMPHILVPLGGNTFQIQKIDYSERAAGNNTSNPVPSFVGKKISNVFFTGNRLGFTAEDNVILSQAGDYFNFYAQSVLIASDADPIDLNCQSDQSTRILDVIVTAQGTVLISEYEQFVLFSDTGFLSPNTALVKQISSHMIRDTIPSVRWGTSIVMGGGSSKFAKAFSLNINNLGANPQLERLSLLVDEYISGDVDRIAADNQNQFMVMYGKDAEGQMYFFRRFSEGGQVVFNAWFKWKLLSNLYHVVTRDGKIMLVTDYNDGSTTQYALTEVDLFITDTTEVFKETNSTSTTIARNPFIDLYGAGEVGSRSFSTDTTTFNTNCPKLVDNYSFLEASDFVPVAVIVGWDGAGSPSVPVGTVYSGSAISITSSVNNTYNWAVTTTNDLSSNDYVVALGWQFKMRAELPTYYMDQNGSDYTATLTIARLNVNFGFTGSGFLKITPEYNQNTNTSTINVTPADYYVSDGVPTDDNQTLSVPVHQRNENFKAEIISVGPFPCKVNSLTWEGRYSPRFYQRA